MIYGISDIPRTPNKMSNQPNAPVSVPDSFFGGPDCAFIIDYDSEFGAVHITQEERDRRHAAYLHYHADNGCYKISRVVDVPTLVENPATRLLESVATRTRVSIPVFTTPEFSGAKIRNAITGRVVPGRITGRNDELEFFKVRLATGELGADAKSSTLFFQSVEEYERHFYVKCGELAASRVRGAPRRIVDVSSSIRQSRADRLAGEDNAQNAQLYTLVR